MKRRKPKIRIIILTVKRCVVRTMIKLMQSLYRHTLYNKQIVETLQTFLRIPAELDPAHPKCPTWLKRPIIFYNIKVSIQGSNYHYCHPKEDFKTYTHVELGFPSAKPPWYIMMYAEDAKEPTNTVYAYVPIEFIARWIVKTHIKTPKNERSTNLWKEDKGDT